MITMQLIGHAVITVTAVVTLWIRIEHRLTVIETDMKWLKRNALTECNGDRKNESS